MSRDIEPVRPGDVRRRALRARHACPSRDRGLPQAPAVPRRPRARRRRGDLRRRRLVVAVLRDRPGHLLRRLRPHGDGRPGAPLRPGAGRGRHRRAQRAERTYALASAAVVPFTAGLAFFAWAVWEYHAHPPLDYTMPFGDVGDGWVYAMLFALGTLSTLGGPILGLVVGRWLQFRGAAILCSVGLVLLTIFFQGIVEPLRTVRVFWPWTYFGGPYGIDGDPERWLILSGSPQWYCALPGRRCARSAWSWRPCTTARRPAPAWPGWPACSPWWPSCSPRSDGHRSGGAGEPAAQPGRRGVAVVRHAARALPWPLLAAAAVLLYGAAAHRPAVAVRRCGRSRAWRSGCWPGWRRSRTTSRPPPWSTPCREGWPGGPRPAAWVWCSCWAGGSWSWRSPGTPTSATPRRSPGRDSRRRSPSSRPRHTCAAAARPGPATVVGTARGRRCHVPRAGAAVREPAAGLPLPRGGPVVRQPQLWTGVLVATTVWLVATLRSARTSPQRKAFDSSRIGSTGSDLEDDPWRIPRG